jgi:hypothetical protein
VLFNKKILKIVINKLEHKAKARKAIKTFKYTEKD